MSGTDRELKKELQFLLNGYVTTHGPRKLYRLKKILDFVQACERRAREEAVAEVILEIVSAADRGRPDNVFTELLKAVESWKDVYPEMVKETLTKSKEANDR